MTFVQPYVPAYRVPLFDSLAALLAAEGVDLEVAHGEPTGDQAARADARLGEWSRPLKSRRARVLGHGVTLRYTGALARASDIVVAEFASTNVDTYLLAVDPHVRLMLWGHGKAYVSKSSRLDAGLEMWLARRAERLFLYTQGGADYLAQRNYDLDKITVVRNSTDTKALRQTAVGISDEQVAEFRSAWRLSSGPVACFIGSFDQSKQLPLLFAAARLVQTRVPDFTLLIAGAGPQQDLVRAAAERWPFVRVLPRADMNTLARIGHVASFVVIPGRVGLVAVDALALGLPVVTTTFPRHAPEAEYLQGKSVWVTAQTAGALADSMVDLLTDPQLLAESAATAVSLGASLSIESMAAAFAEPLLRAL